VSESDRYIKAWGDRRARLFMLWVMIIGFCMSLRIWPNPWIAGACFVGAMIGAYGYYEFRCPRCRERFLPFPDNRLTVWWRRSCQSCGLEKNAVAVKSDSTTEEQ
jgi:hypothetical protein